MLVRMAGSMVVSINFSGINLGTGKFEESAEITRTDEVFATVDDPGDDGDDN